MREQDGYSLKGAVNIMASGPLQQVSELAALAESVGFSRLWLADEGLRTRDVMVSLASLAQATETVKLGPGVTHPYARHPAVTISAIAAIDELSGGRSFLGLGAGGSMALDPLGLERRHPARTVESMIEVARSLWRGESVTMDVGTFALSEARIASPRSDIEIHVAGRGPRMIELAGRCADGFYVSHIHKARLGEELSRLRQWGRSPTITYSARIVTDDAGWEKARRASSFRLVDSQPDVRRLIGLGDSDLEALRSAVASGGPAEAAHLVRDEWIAPFVIAGSPGECRRELQELATEHGIDEFLIMIDDLDSGAEVIDTLAPIVIPDLVTDPAVDDRE